jgi:hypothetical protein
LECLLLVEKDEGEMGFVDEQQLGEEEMVFVDERETEFEDGVE